MITWRNVGFFLISVVLTFSFRGSFVFAATVTSLSSQPTSLVVSTSSNQSFSFTLQDAWALGTTVTFTFPTGFSLATLTEDDIDVLQNGTNVTTASNCAGAEKVSAVFTGQVLTLTVCALNGGNMAIGDVVRVLIGTNATSSGTGTHRAVNPASLGTVYIDIGGTSGVLGSVPVPLVSSSSSGVSGTIASAVSSTTPPSGGPATVYPTPTTSPTSSPSSSPSPSSSVSPTATPSTSPTSTPPATSVSPSSTPSPSPTSSATSTPSPSSTGTPQSPDFAVGVSAYDIPLSLSTGDVEVIIDSEPLVTIDLLDTVLPEDVAVVYVQVDSVTYALDAVEGGLYAGNIVVPDVAEPLLATVVLENGDVLKKDVLLSPSLGLVYEMQGEERVPVPGAVLTVYRVLENGEQEVWNAQQFGQLNPYIAHTDGSFSWYVPNGTYRVFASKDGYQENGISVVVTRNVLSGFIELSSEKEVPAVVSLPTISVVQQTVQTGAVVAAVVSLAILTLFDLWQLLRGLLPWLFFIIGKRKQFGIVYNAVTKQPLDLVTVRLYRVSDGRLINSMVTNAKGEYFFEVDRNDIYRIEVVKYGFIFPSEYLQKVEDDGAFDRLYYGGSIEVKNDEERRLIYNIPMDPLENGALHEPWKIRIKRGLQFVLWMLTPIGVTLAVFAVALSPGWLTWGLLALQVAVLLFNWRLTRGRVVRGDGVVRDAHGRPVAQVTVRLFETTFNKLVQTTVTDTEGRYVFFLGPNTYTITAEKEGFATTKIENIDLREQKGVEAFGKEIVLPGV